MTKVKLNPPNELTRSRVHIKGTSPIMFDRFVGMGKGEAPPEQKLYLDPDTSVIGLPALNILSLFTAQNTDSAPKMFLDVRRYKRFAAACASSLAIFPAFIPFQRDGKPIVFGGFNSQEVDPLSGCYVRRDVARLAKGIPNPKVRPVLPSGWELEFEMTLLPTPDVDEQDLANLFVQAGTHIGLGTFRRVFGKFAVTSWT